DGDIQENNAFVCSNTSNWKKGCNKHLIARKYKHNKYNSTEEDYDIGLVRVKVPFNGKFEKPIKWAGSNFKYPDNAQVTVLGWGYTHPNEEKLSDVLRYVNVQSMNYNTCKKRYKERSSIVTSRMMCAMDIDKDACRFDSGGPLVLNRILI
ncbi:hypothetical protein ILUMI_17240, partial [Ignelater luminosus]